MRGPRTRRRHLDSELRRGWQQRRHYPDHMGNLVVLEEDFDPSDRDPEPGEQLAIQVYSTVPLDADHTDLRDYLLGSWSTEDPKPLFEIYSYCPPDVFACIEHNRREIAYRKLQHVMLGTSNPGPLIPMIFKQGHRFPVGGCILLNSHSYRLGHNADEEDYEAIGPGPDWAYFNRYFNHCRTAINKASRVAPSGPCPELYPEGFEMEISRFRRHEMLDQHIVLDVYGNREGFGPGRPFMRYGLEVDEGEPPESPQPSERHIQKQLDKQLTDGNFAVEPAFRLSKGDDSSVTITNTVDDGEPDLKYLLYAPFLSHLRDDSVLALLETTARLFTAALLANLPPAKTLHLEFRIPASADWSAILPAHRDALSSHDDGDNFSIGALHTLSLDDNDPNQPPAPYRVFPQERSDRGHYAAWRMLKFPYRVFAVVLDRPDFVNRPGVCFYMTDYDDSNDPDISDCLDTHVLRSAGMPEVARRLAMLAVEEEQNGVTETRQLLTDEPIDY